MAERPASRSGRVGARGDPHPLGRRRGGVAREADLRDPGHPEGTRQRVPDHLRLPGEEGEVKPLRRLRRRPVAGREGDPTDLRRRVEEVEVREVLGPVRAAGMDEGRDRARLRGRKVGTEPGRVVRGVVDRREPRDDRTLQGREGEGAAALRGQARGRCQVVHLPLPADGRVEVERHGRDVGRGGGKRQGEARAPDARVGGDDVRPEAGPEERRRERDREVRAGGGVEVDGADAHAERARRADAVRPARGVDRGTPRGHEEERSRSGVETEERHQRVRDEADFARREDDGRLEPCRGGLGVRDEAHRDGERRVARIPQRQVGAPDAPVPAVGPRRRGDQELLGERGSHDPPLLYDVRAAASRRARPRGHQRHGPRVEEERRAARGGVDVEVDEAPAFTLDQEELVVPARRGLADLPDGERGITEPPLRRRPGAVHLEEEPVPRDRDMDRLDLGARSVRPVRLEALGGRVRHQDRRAGVPLHEPGAPPRRGRDAEEARLYAAPGGCELGEGPVPRDAERPRRREGRGRRAAGLVDLDVRRVVRRHPGLERRRYRGEVEEPRDVSGEVDGEEAARLRVAGRAASRAGPDDVRGDEEAGPVDVGADEGGPRRRALSAREEAGLAGDPDGDEAPASQGRRVGGQREDERERRDSETEGGPPFPRDPAADVAHSARGKPLRVKVRGKGDGRPRRPGVAAVEEAGPWRFRLAGQLRVADGEEADAAAVFIRRGEKDAARRASGRDVARFVDSFRVVDDEPRRLGAVEADRPHPRP